MYNKKKGGLFEFQTQQNYMNENYFKEDFKNIKKPSLNFDLIITEDNSPKLDSYIGGTPYLTENDSIPNCPHCKKNMEFIFQFYIPNRDKENYRLYSFYFCFDCIETKGDGSFGILIHENPKSEDLVKQKKNKKSKITFCELEFNPVYAIPDWNLLPKYNLKFFKKFKDVYKDKSFETYEFLSTTISDFFAETGFQYRGYPKNINIEDIPICPKSGEEMELFVQMEAADEINLNWAGINSYMLLFKSPIYDEFELRIMKYPDINDDPEDWEDIFEEEDY